MTACDISTKRTVEQIKATADTESKALYFSIMGMLSVLNGQTMFDNVSSLWKVSAETDAKLKEMTGLNSNDKLKIIADDILKGKTGLTSDDVVAKGTGYEKQQIALSLIKLDMMEFLTHMNYNPNDLKKAMLELDMAYDADFSKDSINRAIMDYAKFKASDNASYGTLKAYDQTMTTLAKMIKGDTLNIAGNKDKIYDRNVFLRHIYGKAEEISNMNDKIYGKAKGAFTDLLNKHIGPGKMPKALLNKYFVWTSHNNTKDDVKADGSKLGPHEEPIYTKLREQINADASNGMIDKFRSEDLFSAIVAFKKDFDMFNYGIDSSEKLFFQGDKLFVYKLGNTSVEPVEYNAENYPNSWANRITLLGKMAASSIYVRPANELTAVEKQIVAKFHPTPEAFGLERQDFNLRLGYIPENHEADIGGINHKTVGNIPTLNYLNERIVDYVDDSKSDFTDTMMLDIDMTKQVYSKVADYEYMKNLDRALMDPNVTKFTDKYTMDIAKDEVAKLKASYNNSSQKSNMTKNAIVLASSMNTIYAISSLMKPRSAINNVIGAKTTAFLNTINLPGLSYVETQNAWRDAGGDVNSQPIRDQIESIVDNLIAPFSRQEAAVQERYDIKDTSDLGTLNKRTMQLISNATNGYADAVSDAGILWLPNVMLKKAFGMDLSKNPLVSMLSQRGSEKFIRKDYYKGLFLQLVNAKISSSEANGVKLSANDAIKFVANDFGDYIGRLERHVHGSFTKRSKSMATWFNMQNAQTVGDAARGLLLSSMIMFKNVEAFSLQSFAGRLGAMYAGVKHADNKEIMAYALKSSIAASIPALAFLTYDLLSESGVAPNVGIVSSANPASLPLDLFDISVMLGQMAFGDSRDENIINRVGQKLARIGAGTGVNHTLQSALDYTRSSEPMLDRFVDLVMPSPEMATKLIFGLGHKFNGERKLGNEMLRDIPVFGQVLSNATDRMASMVKVGKEASDGKLYNATWELTRWLFTREFGIMPTFMKAQWGFMQRQNLSANMELNPDMKDTMYTMRQIGI